MYLLDTNTLIYFLKGIGNVAGILLSKPPQQIAIPAIVRYELEVGIVKSESPDKKRAQLEAFCDTVRIIPFDAEELTHSAAIRAALEKQGHPIGPYDILIAGTALANNATLVTHNIGEFSRIHNLRIEDWF